MRLNLMIARSCLLVGCHEAGYRYLRIALGQANRQGSRLHAACILRAMNYTRTIGR